MATPEGAEVLLEELRRSAYQPAQVCGLLCGCGAVCGCGGGDVALRNSVVVWPTQSGIGGLLEGLQKCIPLGPHMVWCLLGV